MNRNVFSKWTGLALAISVAGVPLVGCGSEDKGSAESASAGSVGFALSLPDGTTVDNVTYVLTGPNSYSKTGSFSVAGAGKTFTHTLPGIPAGVGYKIALTATSSDSRPCVGQSAEFTVLARQSVNVSVVLSCQGKGNSGTVVINGTLNICPVGDSAIANPATAAVGSTITLTGTGTDEDTGPSALSYSWAASGSAGTISNATAANATFTCNSAGSSTVTLTVNDGDTQCTGNTVSVDVTCGGGGAVAGTGAAGTGVAGTGVAGTEAAGTGAAGTGAAGTGVAGTGVAGTGVAGTEAAGTGAAGTGVAGTGAAGTGVAGTGAAGTGDVAGTGAAGTGVAGTGAAGTGAAGTGASGTGGTGDSACVTCERAAPVCSTRLDNCLNATGNTASGRAKSVVCQEIVACFRSTQCTSKGMTDSPSDCFCGQDVDVAACAANTFAGVTGACKAIIAEGAEIETPAEVGNRFADESYALGLAYSVIQCDQRFCGGGVAEGEQLPDATRECAF